jgi:hypothetical protein
MAKLIAFGDSFTWGSDMADTMRYPEFQKLQEDDHTLSYLNTYSRSTWQNLAAEHLGLTYKCLAQEGCSNQTIYRRFFETATQFKSDDVISVNFTWRNRYDFFDVAQAEWHTVRPGDAVNDEYAKLYYKYIQSHNWDQVESLKVINGVVDYLVQNKLKYIITCIDHLIYTDPTHSSLRIIKQLQKIHADKIVWFEGLGFHEWSKIKQFPISPMWHPLEDAHRAGFALLKDNGIFNGLT